VISALLDVTGGLAAFMGIQQKLAENSLEKKLKQFGKLGTIDLRVDYLRPGLGRLFISSGYSLRTGNKVAVTRIELHNETGALIAVGTGSYVIA
jgi:acyl-coenzyme A thioesterase PaaI-like protein